MAHRISTAVLKVIVVTLGVLAALVWGAVAYRLLSVLLGVALVVVLAFRGFRSRRGLVIGSLCAWIAATVSPLDVSFRSVQGPPRVVPLVMGTLPEEGFAAEKRGEFVGGGCIVSGFEPRWVIVW